MDLLYKVFNQNKMENKFVSFPKLLLMLFTYSLSYFYIGYTMAYFTNFQSPFLLYWYGLALKGVFRALYMGLIGFGAAVGVLVSKVVIEKYAKRQFLMILNTFAIFIGVLLLWITDIYLVFIIRLCQGFCCGLYSMLIPAIFQQICPSRMLPRFRSINYSIFALSLVIVYAFGYSLSSVYELNKSAGMGWSIVLAFPLAVLAIQSALLEFMFPHESAVYLLKNNRFDEAEEGLFKFYNRYYAIEILKRTEEEIQQAQKKGMGEIEQVQPQQFPNRAYNIANPLLMNNQQPSNNYQRKKSQISIMAAFLILVLQQFSGIHALIPYGFYLTFNAAPNKFYLPVILFIIMALSSQLTPLLLEKLQRKWIILGSTVVCTLSNALISYGMYYNEDPKHLAYTKNSGFVIAGLVLLVINFGSCVGPVFDQFVEDVMPKGLYYFGKAAGWGVAGFVVLECSADWNYSVVFLVFAIWSFLSILLNWKYVIETKGKSKAQIQEEYQRMAYSMM